MIDWLKVIVPVPHVKINGGFIVNFDRDHCPEYSIDKTFTVESTHSTKIQVRSNGAPRFDGFFSELLIDGNIVKYFQGHNIVGTDNVTDLVLRFVDHLVDTGVLLLAPYANRQPLLSQHKYLWREDIIHGEFIVKRLDINYMFLVTGGSVDEYIQYLADTTRTRFSRTTQPGDGTVYWNQKSTHWAMKCYNKSRELRARKKSHRLPENWPLDVREKIIKMIEKYCRFELVIRSRHLRKIADQLGYNDAYWKAFTNYSSDIGITPFNLFKNFFEKIGLTDMERYSVDDALQKLSPAEYGTFAAWRSGYDVKSKMSIRTYYRHRKSIIEQIGVDIALSADRVEKHSGTSVRTFRVVMTNGDSIHSKIENMLKSVVN